MSIGRRLSIAFGSVALVIAVGAVITIWEFVSIFKQARILAALDAKLVSVYRVRADVGAIRRRLDRVAKTRNGAAFDQVAQSLRKETTTDIQEAVSSFHETSTPVPAALSALGNRLVEQLNAMHHLQAEGSWDAIPVLLDTRVDEILDSIRQMTEHVSSDVAAQRLSSLDEIEAGQHRAQAVLVITAVVSLAVALVLGIYTRRRIVQPLGRLKTAAGQLSEGNFAISPDVSSNDELADVSRAFVIAAGKLNQYYLALKRSNEDLERFAYAASHDLQEPLRTITVFSELLKLECGQSLSPNAQQYFSFVSDAAARMRELITGILEYSRMARADVPLEQTVDTEDVFKTVLKNLQGSIDETHAVVTYDDLPSVIGSRVKLVQLFQNLVANAIKYRREAVPPHVHISAELKNGFWEFSIEDNGIGIAPQYQQQIFQMFKQLDRSSKGGVGLGLAVAKRIVEQHGGEILVASVPGEGSRFTFTLKRAVSDNIVPEITEAASAK